MTLRSRVEKLEAVHDSQESRMLIITRVIVGPGEENEPLATIRDSAGQCFTQLPGESEDDFVERVARLKGWPERVACLILFPAKDPIEDDPAGSAATELFG